MTSAPETIAPGNAEATEAWDGPLFDVFVKIRHLLVDGLARHGDAALAAHPPQPGERVLDIGCGFGDATFQLATFVGAEGHVTGVDVSERFIASANADLAAAGIDNVEFHARDVQVGDLGSGYDLAFARFGTMFFSNPVQALRNIRSSLRPGGQFTMVVWRLKEHNAWAIDTQAIVERHIARPEDSDQPTCGPGPFSMGNADTVTGQLMAAGFSDISLLRCDQGILIGRDMDEAVDYIMSIGPAGEILRLAGEDADPFRATIATQLAEYLAQYVEPDGGVWAPASSWIINATSRAAD